MSDNALFLPLLLLGLHSATAPAPNDPRMQPAPAPSPALYAPASSPADKRSSCRPFKTLTEIEGRYAVLEGKACRQADGTWKTF